MEIPLDAFRCAAEDLIHPSLKGWTMWLRLDGDTDDPATWHQVACISDEGTRTDASQAFVKILSVSFHDGTPDVIFNDNDEVEFAVIRPPHPSENR